ncbi:hypothetical protein [Mesorhizobium sp. B2-3-4]|uniref:hypothetical protein n=1 Tax=Mesorhizobium sp. B2-3-4 TaxID=2589959 RepID=UPI001126D24B|nr:hypothetical protein [Mesorhizobium sp. B2-3-4]TPM30163.1 hypothetical protein FJ967_26735 [Mesorhizobium sp. B2-3-4]
MRWLAVLAVLGLVSIPPAVSAQTQPGACSYAPTILAAADFLLAEPATFPNFWRDRYGDDAAYLKIHYGNLNDTEGSALLSGLEKRSHPPLRIAELRLAYATPAERAAIIAGMQPAPNKKSVVGQLGESALRALVAEDGGTWLLGELARLQTLDPADASSAATAIAQTLTDLEADAKSRLAKRAQDAGVVTLALPLLAIKDSLADYMSYLDRLPPAALPNKDSRGQMIRKALYASALRPSFDISKQPAEVQAVYRQNDMARALQPIGQLVNHAPVAEILLTAVNQSGDLRVGTVVAAGLNARISAKQLDPVGDPDALIASMVDGLDYIFGHSGREGILVTFGVTGMQGETAEEFVDRALARVALTPFLQGIAAESPSRPAQLAATFPWELWVGLAGRLKAGGAITSEDHIVAADLMLAAGRPADALRALETASDWKTALLRSHGLAFALDRRCANLLGRPIPFSQPLYRF